MMRRLWIVAVAAIAMAALFAGFGFWNARGDPVVHRASIALPRWPAGAPPVTVALISDVHAGGAAMDAARLARIAERIAVLKPDLVLIAGDFVSGHAPGSAAAVAPALTHALARIHPPLGTIAVLGNHDHWTGAAAVRGALNRAGVTVLVNEAVVRGPLAIGGIDDEYTGHDRLPETLAQLRRLPGARVMVSHSPDIAPALPGDVALLFAGHTHCGQIVLPLWGAIAVPSAYGSRYLCGVIREGARATIVTGGLGTSLLPLRFGAPPDLWLVRLGPG